ncbi:MAG: hypothetical protein E7290_04780 [Lachnospiraceae bacterium]|nr:hypothetical protein [Lachnospiraceae bacterium]
MKKSFKKFRKVLAIAACITTMLMNSIMVLAIDDSTRHRAKDELNQYYTEMKYINEIDEDIKKKMDKVYEKAMTFMTEADFDEESEIQAYLETAKGNLDRLLSKNPSAGSTSNFIMLSNEMPVITASYGEDTFVVLSLMNLGVATVQDVVVTPVVSTDVKEYPFEIKQAYDAQYIEGIAPGSDLDDANAKRMDIGWMMTVREDALTGCYPLHFNVQYYVAGEYASTEVTTYINIMGNEKNGTLAGDKEEEEKQSNPRIIVTGFKTEPETVYAGSVFDLTVSVQNTSAETEVKNVLFQLEAVAGGNDSTSTSAVFLPTSGSSAIYTGKIAPGESYDIKLQMEAKSDLAQKPYVLTINTKYDTENAINLTDVANVSIPVKQEAKMDVGTAEIMPGSIAVGEQSNVMFSIFNTGKTTLYNVKVIYESETVESGMTYIGNLAPGATGNVDSMLTGIAPDMGDGTVLAVVTYEDEAGNETRYEVPIALLVYEDYMEEEVWNDYPMEGDMSYMGEEVPAESGNAGVFIIVGIVAVIVIIIVVVIVVKKKKAAKQRKEELDLLDED